MTRLKLIIPLSLLLTVLAACGQDNTDRQEIITLRAPTPTVQTVVVIATRYLMLERGTMTYENGCLLMETIAGKRYSLVWWTRLKPIVHEDEGIVEIITPESEPIIVTLNSQLVEFGGGASKRPQAPEFDVVDENAGVDHCPPPYWLVGTVRPQ